MADLKSKPWIVLKGLLFAALGFGSGGLLLLEAPTPRTLLLLLVLAWSSCRFYYFLFYVLEHYVDPTMRYAGLWDLLQGMKQRRTRARKSGAMPDTANSDPPQPL